MDNLDKAEHNSQLGLTSRSLAFALLERVANKKIESNDVYKLQEALYDYGVAIAKKTCMLDRSEF